MLRLAIENESIHGTRNFANSSNIELRGELILCSKSREIDDRVDHVRVSKDWCTIWESGQTRSGKGLMGCHVNQIDVCVENEQDIDASCMSVNHLA
jgi:hypothetical protein